MSQPNFAFTNTFDLTPTEPVKQFTAAYEYSVGTAPVGFDVPSAIFYVSAPDGNLLWHASWPLERQRDGVGRIARALLESQHESAKLGIEVDTARKQLAESRTTATKLQSEYDTILRQQYVDGGSSVAIGALLLAVAITAGKVAHSWHEESDDRSVPAAACSFFFAVFFMLSILFDGPETLSKLLNAPYYAAKEFAALKKD